MGKKLKNKKIAESPELSALADDLDKVTAIAIVAESEGGELLVKGLISDVVSSLDTIAVKHSSLSINEFIALGASIKANLDLMRALKRSKKNKKELQGMLEEALQE